MPWLLSELFRCVSRRRVLGYIRPGREAFSFYFFALRVWLAGPDTGDQELGRNNHLRLSQTN